MRNQHMHTLKHIHPRIWIHHTYVCTTLRQHNLISAYNSHTITYTMHTHTHTHAYTHPYTVQLSSSEPRNTFEGYLVEARESITGGEFANSSSIWGSWLYNQSSPYHTINCNRSLTSQDGPYPVSPDNSTDIGACRGGWACFFYMHYEWIFAYEGLLMIACRMQPHRTALRM